MAYLVQRTLPMRSIESGRQVPPRQFDPICGATYLEGCLSILPGRLPAKTRLKDQEPEGWKSKSAPDGPEILPSPTMGIGNRDLGWVPQTRDPRQWILLQDQTSSPRAQSHKRERRRGLQSLQMKLEGRDQMCRDIRIGWLWPPPRSQTIKYPLLRHGVVSETPCASGRDTVPNAFRPDAA